MNRPRQPRLSRRIFAPFLALLVALHLGAIPLGQAAESTRGHPGSKKPATAKTAKPGKSGRSGANAKTDHAKGKSRRAPAASDSGRKRDAPQTGRGDASPREAAGAGLVASEGVDRKDIESRQEDLGELRGRIDSLRKDIATAEESQADVADKLKDTEQEISRLSLGLRDLGRQRAQLEQSLRNLGEQSRGLQASLGQQQTQLEQLLAREYMHGRLTGSGDPLQLLLGSQDTNRGSRDVYYLGSIAQARADLLKEVRGSLARKESLREETEARAAELAAVEEQQKEQHNRLAEQRAQRQTALNQIAAQIANRKQTLDTMQADERRLSQLIDGLSRILAQRAAREKEQREQREREAKEQRERENREREAREQREREKRARTAQANRPEITEPRTEPRAEPRQEPRPEVRPESRPEPRSNPVVHNERVPEPTGSGPTGPAFSSQRGNLHLPVRGSVIGRFGAAREGGGVWKGVFIRASGGTEVHAVSHGRVVFAEWMRGFGNLLIVDHGDGYLSIYGNNEALLRQVGDSVRGGDALATVGNTGGQQESGLYFELRYQGQPLDPLKWVSLK